jgi:hypothetical protein
MVDFFQKPTGTATKAKAKKAAKVERVVKGVEALAEVCAFEKHLKTLKTEIETPVKDAIINYMVTECNGSAPDSFQGNESECFANLQARKRSSTSALEDIEVAALKAAKIDYEEKTTFVINEAYASDSKLLAQVSAALSKIPNLPTDFITASSKNIVSDDTVRQVFALRTKKGLPDRDKIAALLPIVVVPAARPVFVGDMDKAIDKVAKKIKKLVAENQEAA